MFSSLSLLPLALPVVVVCVGGLVVQSPSTFVGITDPTIELASAYMERALAMPGSRFGWDKMWMSQLTLLRVLFWGKEPVLWWLPVLPLSVSFWPVTASQKRLENWQFLGPSLTTLSLFHQVPYTCCLKSDPHHLSATRSSKPSISYAQHCRLVVRSLPPSHLPSLFFPLFFPFSLLFLICIWVNLLFFQTALLRNNWHILTSMYLTFTIC